LIKLFFLASVLFLIFMANNSNATSLPEINPGIRISENSGNDSLIVGRNYVFGTKQKFQYSGKLLDFDSLYYRIETKAGVMKIKKDDVLIYKEGFTGLEQKELIIDTTNYQTIELKDGNDITGEIVGRDSVSILVKTKSGILMTVPKSEIVGITKSAIEYFDGKYYVQDPNDARLFIAPTARPIRKNSGFISDVELFFPMAGIGIENIVSLVGGISVIPFAEEQILYINAKVTPVHLQNIDIAAGYIYMNVTSNSEGVSIGYFGGTFGTNDAAFTGGLGIAMGKKADNSPMFILGGEIRAGNHVKFISENWIFTYKNAPVFSLLGIRVFGSKFAADFAFMKVWEEHTGSGFPLIPYLSFTYNLGFQ
jgi:hypothetical protein